MAPRTPIDVRAIRKAQGWTQVQMAQQMHSTERTVRRWEREGRMPYGYARKALRALAGECLPERAEAPPLGLLPSTFPV